MIGKRKNRSLEIIKSEEQKEKRVKKNEESLRDLWDIIKGSMYTLKDSQERERKYQRTYSEK